MRAETDKNKLASRKAGMSYLQISILIIEIFSFSYFIYSATEVSAQALDYACCEKTSSGEKCQFVPESECNSSFRKSPTECKYTDYCKLGCCYSSSTGLCSENAPKGSCDGAWKEDAFCNIPECKKGCCVLGRNALWTTSRNCQAESGALGMKTDFRADINSEIECIFLAEKDDEGACVAGGELGEEKTCKFTTRESCKGMNGNFYKDIFCSDSGLGTGCKAKDHAACAKNKNNDGQSAYWFDSCGNKENVKEECSIFTGTICGLVNGEAKCKSIDCEVDGKTRKNGESWCEYEGTIGNGRDVVGSRQVKHICFMGEERTEPCEDYRNQVCVQSDTDIGNGKIFSEAACRINNWRACLDYNNPESKSSGCEGSAGASLSCMGGQAKSVAEKCRENPDCTIKGVHIDKFSFDVCVPNYPPGFDLASEAAGKDAEMICGTASQKCTVIYVKTLSGWKCKANCGCEKAGFSQQMNELCTSLGDCGAYVNYAGEVTDEGYSVKGSPKLSSSYLTSLKQYAAYKAGQKATPINLSTLVKLGLASEPSYKESMNLNQGMGVYGIGFALQVAKYYFGYSQTLSKAVQSAIGITTPTGPPTSAGATLGTFGNALAALGNFMMVASIISMAFGIDYTSALMIAGTGIVLGSLYFTGGLNFQWLWNPITIIVILIAYIVLKILGVGKTKKKIVQFTCLPWQPPSGGKDCSKCNPSDALGVPCSKYRCQSLGQACQLINEGTGQELCVNNNPNEVSSPRISPLLGMITEGYEYYDIKDTGFSVANSEDKGCIPEFTNVIFGIKTDKPSQCKLGTEPMQSYDEMEDFFGNSNLYLYNHTTSLNLPSIPAFASQYNLTRDEIKKIGEFNIYVKCKSVNGKVNDASYTIKSCVKPGPDLTAPAITKTSPANGAFVKYNASKQELLIWVNEPSDCRWSLSDGKYDSMENSFECQTDLEDYGLWGWPCNTTLTGLDKNSKFYIKCKDQPWLANGSGNLMRQSYVYELQKSSSELNIDEISPSGETVAGTEPVTVNLEAKTSGGAEQGKSVCSYKFSETDSYINFFDTGSSYHKQVFSQITRGSYKIYVRCEDSAGNIAEKSIEFTVSVDTEAPAITRAYYDGSLKIITNENSVCAYSVSDNRCNFEIENSTLMPGEEKEHSADWQIDESYYIKCKDSYGNEPGGCSAVIRAYNII